MWTNKDTTLLVSYIGWEKFYLKLCKTDEETKMMEIGNIIFLGMHFINLEKDPVTLQHKSRLSKSKSYKVFA